jgi:hypothetical protein
MLRWKPSALIGLVLTLPSLIFFALFGKLIAPTFAKMFSDFGSTAALPFATRLVVHPATPLVVIGFLFAGIVAGALRPHERFLIMPLLAACGFLMSVASMIALYLPLWTIGDVIK